MLQQLECQKYLIDIQDELIEDLLLQGSDNFFIVAGLNYLPVRNERQIHA